MSTTTPPYQLWKTREEKADLEARNGLLLSEAVEKMVEPAKKGFALTPQLICSLHEIAIRDIYTCAGKFRRINVEISNTPHVPPNWQDVPRYVDQMCAYINENFGKSPLHLSAYLMWRHNWIHPFAGGNGRTSRAISYLVLNVRLGFLLPGQNTIAEQIVKRRQPYYQALASADKADREGRLDISEMEELISNMLAAQLYSIHTKAHGQ